MELVIQPDGAVRCIYGEAVDLHTLGRLSVQRASHVEPTDSGQWTADLAPVGGPLLGPFEKRSEALEAEAKWLEGWLSAGPPSSGRAIRFGVHEPAAAFQQA